MNTTTTTRAVSAAVILPLLAAPLAADIRFEPVAEPAGAWGDYDNDGALDLFTVYREGNDLLFRSNGDGSFAPVTTEPLVRDGAAGISCGWADYDNDGLLDLVNSTVVSPEPSGRPP